VLKNQQNLKNQFSFRGKCSEIESLLYFENKSKELPQKVKFKFTKMKFNADYKMCETEKRK
jgi:hypothetical protein